MSLLINLSLSLMMILSSSLQSRMYLISALNIYYIDSFFFAYISSKSCCWSSSLTRRRISYCSLVCYSSYRSSLQGNIKYDSQLPGRHIIIEVSRCWWNLGFTLLIFLLIIVFSQHLFQKFLYLLVSFPLLSFSYLFIFFFFLLKV